MSESDEIINAVARKLCEDAGKKPGDPYYLATFLHTRADVIERFKMDAAIEWVRQQNDPAS